MRKNNRAFTLIELLVVISIIALLIGILLPALGAARTTARKMQNTVNLRSMHQACVIFGQDNKNYYPGLHPDGSVWTNAELDAAGITPSTGGHSGIMIVPRLAFLVHDDVISPEFLVSPADTDRTAADPGEKIRNHNNSYAALDIRVQNFSTSDARNAWRDDMNTQTTIYSDRNTSLVPGTAGVSSVWSPEVGTWEGGVVFNDNHAETLGDPFVPGQVGSAPAIENDFLFDNAAASIDGDQHGTHLRMIKYFANQTFGAAPGGIDP